MSLLRGRVQLPQTTGLCESAGSGDVLTGKVVRVFVRPPRVNAPHCLDFVLILQI